MREGAVQEIALNRALPRAGCYVRYWVRETRSRRVGTGGVGVIIIIVIIMPRADNTMMMSGKSSEALHQLVMLFGEQPWIAFLELA